LVSSLKFVKGFPWATTKVCFLQAAGKRGETGWAKGGHCNSKEW